MNEGILTRSRFHNKTLANQAIFLFSISTTFITPPNYYMWVHVIAFLVTLGDGNCAKLLHSTFIEVNTKAEKDEKKKNNS